MTGGQRKAQRKSLKEFEKKFLTNSERCAKLKKLLESATKERSENEI